MPRRRARRTIVAMLGLERRAQKLEVVLVQRQARALAEEVDLNAVLRLQPADQKEDAVPAAPHRMSARLTTELADKQPQDIAQVLLFRRRQRIDLVEHRRQRVAGETITRLLRQAENGAAPVVR